MSYQNFYYNRKDGNCHLWTDEGYEVFPFEPYAYQIDSKGEFKTLTGLKVKKVKSWSKEAEKEGLIFEHDVPTATRVLIDRYFETDEPSKNNRIFFFDIEVEKGLRYSTPKDALNRITSIAYYFNEEYVCLLLDETKRITNQTKTIFINGQEIKTKIERFNSERELLMSFVVHWNKIKPSIVVGWNSETYDIPYITNRIENVLGWKYSQKLSPIGIVEKRDLGKDFVVKIAGVSHLDYMQLYKKFTYNEEPSYALDYISKKELKRGKYVYDGTLDDLFNNNLDGFIEYNVNDVELMVALDKKMDLIEIARGICHAGHVPYDDYQFSSRYLEGASLVYCKRNGYVAIRSNIGGGDEGQAEGAAVKQPIPGFYKYIIDCDLTSLYPSLIRTLNISPETIFGKVTNWNEQDWMNKVEKDYVIEPYSTIQDKLMGTDIKPISISHSNFWNYITENNLSIASNGLLLKQDKDGLIPSILTHWFNERKRLSKLAEEYGNKGDEVNYKYYDQRQLIQKILLNSFYGVLLLPSFRFYNKDAGEAITISGQHVIKFSMKVANKFCNSKVNTDNVDYIIASDTDSVFLSVYNLVNPNNEDLNQEEMVKRTLEFANELQTTINKSYDFYASKLFNVKTHYLNIKQEMIALRGFFLNVKKRYALRIINKKGVAVNELEVKGLDMVRSSFPKIFRSEMKELINDILHDITLDKLNLKVRNFKQSFKNTPLQDILLPTSVKELSKFEGKNKGTPIHVKSAQNYNRLLELHKIESIPKIDDGDKILYAYVKTNPFGFETLALKGIGEENPPEIVSFMEKYVDREKIFQNTFLSKLETIWTDLGWGKIELQEQNDFF